MPPGAFILTRVAVEEFVGPDPDLVVVLLGHAEQRTDHHDRKLGSELLDVVETSACSQGLEVFPAEFADAGFEFADTSRGEGSTHEFSQPGVVGRILPDHHGRLAGLFGHQFEHGPIGRAETFVVQGRVHHVAEARKRVEVEFFVSVDGCLIAKAFPGGMRIRVDRVVVGVVVGVAGKDGGVFRGFAHGGESIS